MDCRLLLISGSLRTKSTNSAALRTAAQLAPPGFDAVVYDGLATLPHFNPDDDSDAVPVAVAALRAEIHAAGALLISTPEYAGALPGSFKNLLDWTIGDDEPGSIYEKPVAWINASARGARAAHDELRRVLGYAHATIVEPACVDTPITDSMISDDRIVMERGARETIARSVASLAVHARCGQVGASDVNPASVA
jgi:NAD(P)H-dependent FMN reductase